MAMKGWRRIGIVLSVLAFFPLGILIWKLPTVSEILYDMRTNTCGKVRQYDLDGIDQVHDMDKWSKVVEESNVWYERCISKTYREYESTNPPSQTKRLLIVIAIVLVLIGLGWLIAWDAWPLAAGLTAGLPPNRIFRTRVLQE
jgi:hypothetical protein